MTWADVKACARLLKSTTRRQSFESGVAAMQALQPLTFASV